MPYLAPDTRNSAIRRSKFGISSALAGNSLLRQSHIGYRMENAILLAHKSPRCKRGGGSINIYLMTAISNIHTMTTFVSGLPFMDPNNRVLHSNSTCEMEAIYRTPEGASVSIETSDPTGNSGDIQRQGV